MVIGAHRESSLDSGGREYCDDGTGEGGHPAGAQAGERAAKGGRRGMRVCGGHWRRWGQVLCTAAKAIAASRHQSSIAVVIQRVSSWCISCLSDGYELLGVDVLWRHSEALEAIERRCKHGGRPTDEDVGGAEAVGQ
jgi:hypothetical protein